MAENLTESHRRSQISADRDVLMVAWQPYFLQNLVFPNSKILNESMINRGSTFRGWMIFWMSTSDFVLKFVTTI